MHTLMTNWSSTYLANKLGQFPPVSGFVFEKKWDFFFVLPLGTFLTFYKWALKLPYLLPIKLVNLITIVSTRGEGVELPFAQMSPQERLWMTRKTRSQALPEQHSCWWTARQPQRNKMLQRPQFSLLLLGELPLSQLNPNDLSGFTATCAHANGILIWSAWHRGVPNVTGLNLDFSLSGLNEFVLGRTCMRSRSKYVFCACNVTAKVTQRTFANIDLLIKKKEKENWFLNVSAREIDVCMSCPASWSAVFRCNFHTRYFCDL